MGAQGWRLYTFPLLQWEKWAALLKKYLYYFLELTTHLHRDFFPTTLKKHGFPQHQHVPLYFICPSDIILTSEMFDCNLFCSFGRLS